MTCSAECCESTEASSFEAKLHAARTTRQGLEKYFQSEGFERHSIDTNLCLAAGPGSTRLGGAGAKEELKCFVRDSYTNLLYNSEQAFDRSMHQ